MMDQPVFQTPVEGVSTFSETGGLKHGCDMENDRFGVSCVRWYARHSYRPRFRLTPPRMPPRPIVDRPEAFCASFTALSTAY